MVILKIKITFLFGGIYEKIYINNTFSCYITIFRLFNRKIINKTITENNNNTSSTANNLEENNEESNYVDKETNINKILEEKANKILESMSLEEKVGQMFLIRCNRDTAIEDINLYKVSGFILFDENINNETKESLSNTIKTYQENSLINMIIAVDEEGGTVNRLSWYPASRSVPFYSPQDLYNEGGFH